MNPRWEGEPPSNPDFIVCSGFQSMLGLDKVLPSRRSSVCGVAGLVCIAFLQMSCHDNGAVSKPNKETTSDGKGQGSKPAPADMGLEEAIGALKLGPSTIPRPLFLHDGPGGLCFMTETTRLTKGTPLNPRVIASLKKLGKPGIDAVVRLFQEPDPASKAGAALALAALDPESSSTLEGLDALLVAPGTIALRAYAANALAALGVRAVPLLVRQLEGTDPEIQLNAAFALGLMGPAASPAARRLAQVLESIRGDASGHNHVAAACAFALRRIGMGGLRETLAVLRRSTIPVAELAASAIMIPLDPREAAEAALLIAGSVDGATSEARALLGDLLSKLPGAGAAVRPALSSLLSDPSPAVRLAGALAWATTQSDPEPGIHQLTLLLGDSSIYVRSHAAAALGQLRTRSASAFQRLLDLLQDEAAEVRAASAAASMEIAPDPEILVTPLAKLLSDRDRRVSDAAAGALARIGSPALPVLERALKDPSLEARCAAALALGRLQRVPGAVAALLRAVADHGQPAVVRRGMVSALRRQAERRLDARGKRGGSPAVSAVPALLECLKDEDAIVREEAAGAIGNVGPEARAAAASLLSVLRDGNASVRRAAAFALEQVGYKTSEVVPVLIEAMNDPGLSEAVRERAARLLFEVDPEAARSPSSRAP